MPFTQVNRVFKGGDGVGDVPAMVDDESGLVTTVWMPTYDERIAIMAGKPVILRTISQGMMFPTRLGVYGVGLEGPQQATEEDGKENDENA